MNICVLLGLIYGLFKIISEAQNKTSDTQMADLEAVKENSLAPMANPDGEKPIDFQGTNLDKPEEVGENTQNLE
jgi:hypothetical protein